MAYLMQSIQITLFTVILVSAYTVGPFVYLFRVIIAIDQLGTSLIGGWPGETLSSYAYRLEGQYKIGGRIFRPIIDALFFWQTNHCEGAWHSMLKRMNVAPEFRN